LAESQQPRVTTTAATTTTMAAAMMAIHRASHPTRVVLVEGVVSWHPV
jgi:hypothetical protein